MANTLKTIIIGLVIIVLIGLGWKYYIDKNFSDLKEDVNMPSGVKSETQSANTTATDAALDKDLANIDTELEALSGDSASIDQGLNDKPIPQAE